MTVVLHGGGVKPFSYAEDILNDLEASFSPERMSTYRYHSSVQPGPITTHKALCIRALGLLYCPTWSHQFPGQLPLHVGQLWGQQEDTRQELPPHAADRRRGPCGHAAVPDTQAVRWPWPLPGDQSLGRWKWQVEKGPLWPREKGPPMRCSDCRDVAGRSGATGGHVATSPIVVSPPVARGSLVAGGGLEPVAVADCR